MSLVQSTTVPGDIVQHHDPKVSVESFPIKAPTGVALTDFEILGQPVKLNGSAMELVIAADDSNAEGIVISKKKITVGTAAATVEPYAVLLRGPARLNQARFPANDVSAAAHTIATLVTAYKAMGDVMVVDESSTSATQTT